MYRIRTRNRRGQNNRTQVESHESSTHNTVDETITATHQHSQYVQRLTFCFSDSLIAVAVADAITVTLAATVTVTLAATITLTAAVTTTLAAAVTDAIA